MVEKRRQLLRLSAIHSTKINVLLVQEEKDGGLEFYQERYDPNIYQIDDIFIPVSQREEQEDYETIKYNIVKSGMLYPIIIIPNTPKDYTEAIINVHDEYVVERDPSKPYLAYTGNQRLTIAKEFGFTEISAYLVPNSNWAHATHLRIT